MTTERVNELCLYNALVAKSLGRIAQINAEEGYVGILSPKTVTPYMWVMLGYAQTCFNIDLYFYCGPIEMWLTRKRHPNLKFSKLKKKDNLDINVFLTKLAHDYDQEIGIFEKVYDEFYNKEKND